MPVNDLISRNLKRYREERSLSVSALGRQAGLAKQTIIAIESGRGNPTVETVERLADALDVTMRALLSELGTEILVHPGHDVRWQEQVSGVGVRQLDQAFGSGYVMNTVLRLEGGVTFRCAARGRAALRHCYVLEGIVRLGPTSAPVVADAGDFVRFPADTDHVFEARTPEALVFVNTTAPQLSMAGGARTF